MLVGRHGVTFYLIVFIVPLFFGCESSQHQDAPISPTFTYNGINYVYAKIVFDAYSHAWEPGTNILVVNPITRVTVTIANDGKVVSAKIFKSSGDEQMDKSVQKALDSVSSVQPFESGTKDMARTFIINFDLKRHRQGKT